MDNKIFNEKCFS